VTRWIENDGGTHWIDRDGNECYSTFNLDDPHRKYTFQAFLENLEWCDSTADEGFPGPERYTKPELLKLAQDAIELLDT
jgi:hypothetical protein